MYFPSKIAVVLIFGIFTLQFGVALFDFPQIHINIPKEQQDFLDKLTLEDFKKFVQLGTESDDRETRWEENLQNSAITVHNGTLSHSQLLETWPSLEAQADSDIATKILKSSLYIYNSKCIEHGISGDNCRIYFAKKSIPEDTELGRSCKKILEAPREGHHALRRLLPCKYEDGFYAMYSDSKLPSARLVSSSALHGHSTNVQSGNEALDDGQRSLTLVQWTQFIEHDLSKTVATSMDNGNSIDCCNRDNFKLQPRFLHPACAPLIAKDKYGRESCLNYVRSALALSSNCNFGAAQQLNEATGYLDLSQLYGYTSDAQGRMRTNQLGQIKSTKFSQKLTDDMLPLAAAGERNAFCSLKIDSNETCYMAGDSRVNSNPFSIVLYTIFLRSHNQLAENLHQQHNDWNDDRLYNAAKALNIDIYRRIVFNEWLPAVLGQQLANQINAESIQQQRETLNVQTSELQISNEFAIAAIRFYFSMMPNALNDFATTSNLANNIRKGYTQYSISNSNVSPTPNIYPLQDHVYNSEIVSNPQQLNKVLESILHQRAMKMDSSYAESFIQDYMGTPHLNGLDVLAFDIQRGRDHGIQGYVKYLEQCQGISIKSWTDLERYIHFSDNNKLKSAYNDWNDIDLIIGGISEKPLGDSIVGPTFTCILGEQFSKIHQWHQVIGRKSQEQQMAVNQNWTGARFLCTNSQLENVPKNIFKITSKENPLISCAALLKS